MLYPAMSSLLEHVNSRYLLVNVIARRARQLSIESEITHEPLTDKPVTIAINEVADIFPSTNIVEEVEAVENDEK